MSASEADKIVFLHIPKTAGTVIRWLMRSAVGKENIFEIHTTLDIAYHSDRALNQHRCFMGHIGHAFLDRIEKPCFSFTFLRDPVERVLSLYYYWKSQPPRPAQPMSDGPALAAANELNEFLDLGYVRGQVMAQANNQQTWQLFYDFPMFCRLKHRNVPEQEVLAVAKKHLSELDFVGFQETAAADIERLADTLGWAMPDAMPRMRVTENKPKAEGLADETLAKIHKLTKLDRELYDFAVENLKSGGTP